ncbi:HAD hydrolase family protein [Rummeliibacillus sp. JY-2-4R]
MQFVFDLEGTIYFQEDHITEPILYSLGHLTEKGHEVIFTSSQPLRHVLPVLYKGFHGYKMVGLNGSIICKNGNVKHCAEFDLMTFKKIKYLMEEYHATYLVESVWDYSYTGPIGHPILENLDPYKLAVNKPIERLDNIVKITIVTAFNMANLRKRLANLNCIIHTHYQEGMLDITPCGIQKWKALRALGIQKGKYIVFGNDENDINVFENAKHSVMIGEHPVLSHYADESINYDSSFEEHIVDKVAELDSRFAY